MISKIKCLLARRHFPKKIYNEWFAHQALKKHEGKEQLPPYFDCNDRYIDYKPGDVVSVRVHGKYKAFYKIITWSKYGSDLAMWDDGRQYELILHHIEEIK